jgi:predicted Zn-dependent peptidase
VTVYERRDLANGIRVLSAPMGHAQSTAVFVMVNAGSRYETPETMGSAHFCEHMLFCGTPRRPTVRALTGEVDAIGGLFNATTAKEWTFYWIKCASEYAEQALDVLADMIRNALFEPSEIEREKGVIVEELRAIYVTPRDYIDDVFEELIYGETPLGRRTIGTEETVNAATRESLTDFVQRLYEPSRILVGLAGHVDDAILAKVDEKFGDLESRPTPKPEPPPAPNGGPRVRLETKAADQANLALGAPAYPLSHPDRYALQLFSTVLGGGMSSRLPEEITMQRGLAYSISVFNQAHTDTGSVWAQAGVNVDKIDDAITAIAAELRRMADEPVPADELEKARTYTKSRFVFSIETPQGILRHALRRLTLEGEAAEPAEILAGVDAVTADDVQRVARDVLADGLWLAMIGPYDDAARFEQLI